MAAAPTVRNRHSAICAKPQLYRLAGLGCATILPALFWVALAAAFAQLTGTHFAATALLVAGAAIATFLGAVCAPIMLKA